MLDTPLFTSEIIHLTALDAEEDSPAVAAWTQDSRYIPLSFEDPPRPLSAVQVKNKLEELLEEADEKRNSFWFGIRTADESELLGITGLEWVDWSNGAAHMILNMKDQAEYERAPAQEALSLMRRYVFHELQMHRLSLAVPAYNDALVDLLKKMNLTEEVRQREAVYRFGRRWDLLRFGMLSADWANREKLDEGNSDER
jgi:RimJ/RimL family protein N-acetyltransferase